MLLLRAFDMSARVAHVAYCPENRHGAELPVRPDRPSLSACYERHVFRNLSQESPAQPGWPTLNIREPDGVLPDGWHRERRSQFASQRAEAPAGQNPLAIDRYHAKANSSGHVMSP